MHNKESIQELHEAYQVLLKIILANKDRFKKTSKVIYVMKHFCHNNILTFSQATVKVLRFSKMMTPEKTAPGRKHDRKGRSSPNTKRKVSNFKAICY